jgi:hypothetical protein
MAECDCGAATDGKWADVHTSGCGSFGLSGAIGSKCHVLAEEAIETDHIGIDHQERCVRLGVLIVKTIEEWMAANPPRRRCRARRR